MRNLADLIKEELLEWDTAETLKILKGHGVSYIKIDTEDDGTLFGEEAINHLIYGTNTEEEYTFWFKDMEGVLYRVRKDVEPTFQLHTRWDINLETIDLNILNEGFISKSRALLEEYNNTKKVYQQLLETFKFGGRTVLMN